MATATKPAVKKTTTKKAATPKAAASTTTIKKTTAKKATTKKAPVKADAVFEYFSPDSSSVYVAGTFNNWEMAEMKKDKTGNWKFKAKLPTGDHQYKYVFEGVSWEIDSDAPSITTEFGLNNIISVK